MSSFSLDSETKLPAWAELTQLASKGLAKMNTFGEAVVQNVLQAFRFDFSRSKCIGNESDFAQFAQLFMKYAQRDLSKQSSD